MKVGDLKFGRFCKKKHHGVPIELTRKILVINIIIIKIWRQHKTQANRENLLFFSFFFRKRPIEKTNSFPTFMVDPWINHHTTKLQKFGLNWGPELNYDRNLGSNELNLPPSNHIIETQITQFEIWVSETIFLKI